MDSTWKGCRTLVSGGAMVCAIAGIGLAQSPQIAAWYKLDEASGTTCTDSSGSGLNGIFEGGPTMGVPGAAVGTNTAVHFDGTDDRAVIKSAPPLADLRDQLSAACWMKADTLTGIQRFFGNDGSWTWGITGSSMRFTTRGILDYDLPASLSIGTWHHVAVVFDASYDCTFYLDGLPIGGVSGSKGANPALDFWHIANKDPGPPEWFNGVLDDIQIYKGVLTDADVLYLYDNPGQILSSAVGTNYCGPANKHSGGAGGVMSGWGSGQVAQNNLSLTASSLPAGEWGYFVTSQTQGFQPFPGGSQGNLCLGGKMGRFVKQLSATGTAGTVTVSPDLSSFPMGPPVSVQPGETWNFQFWFTDSNPAPTSNFTDGLSVMFQ
ncbi:MAG: LamG domain-containing protein [bacterium]